MHPGLTPVAHSDVVGEVAGAGRPVAAHLEKGKEVPCGKTQENGMRRSRMGQDAGGMGVKERVSRLHSNRKTLAVSGTQGARLCTGRALWVPTT